MELAIASLNQIKPLSQPLQQHLISILKHRNYSKKEHLLKKGETCKKIWFIESGIVGCFYEQSDRDLCSWFMKEMDICISINSFFLQTPSLEEIIALEEVSACFIYYDELHDIYDKFPEFNWIGREFMTKYYINAEQRVRAFHGQSPLDKYQYLINHQPEIINRVSVKDMARYLGVHADLLSKVRSRTN
jgi:CRP/FNR family transcriptional regulator, anaerobic regulatory protein